MDDPLLFNERMADIEVRKVLARHGKAQHMSIAKVDGKVVRVLDSDLVTRGDLEREVAKCQELLDRAKADLAEFDRLSPQPQSAPAEAAPLTPQAAAPVAPPAALPAPTQPPQPPAPAPATPPAVPQIQ